MTKYQYVILGTKETREIAMLFPKLYAQPMLNVDLLHGEEESCGGAALGRLSICIEGWGPKGAKMIELRNLWI